MRDCREATHKGRLDREEGDSQNLGPEPTSKVTLRVQLWGYWEGVSAADPKGCGSAEGRELGAELCGSQQVLQEQGMRGEGLVWGLLGWGPRVYRGRDGVEGSSSTNMHLPAGAQHCFRFECGLLFSSCLWQAGFLLRRRLGSRRGGHPETGMARASSQWEVGWVPGTILQSSLDR